MILVPLTPAQDDSKNNSNSATVHVWQDTIELPSYEEGPPDENPPFDPFVTNGRYNYPYTMRENLTNRVTPRRWRALNLENEYLKCVILPDLGGHLYRCIDKRNGADLFYANPSLKFARIAYRGVWAAYGIEFNFPVSHNWMTASPVDFATSQGPDGSASIWVRNIDRVYGMEWCVQLTLHPGQTVLEQKTTLYNPGATRHRFYWWTNAGVQVWNDSRLYYPQEFSVFHGFTDLDTFGGPDRHGPEHCGKSQIWSRFAIQFRQQRALHGRVPSEDERGCGALFHANQSAFEKSVFLGQRRGRSRMAQGPFRQ